MAAQMSATEKLLPKNVSATRKNEICLAAGTSATMYNQMAGMHQEARAAFKSWWGPHLYLCEVCQQAPQCIAGIIWRPRGKMLEVLTEASTQPRREREGKVSLGEDEVIYEINHCSF